ncbi:hypothetical protein MPH_12181 [Macrophomina phaseolina MS6]|uniref:Uncharacterized protein n=1 Tax=Macrophomina phaseolina (strain MS6) TaxID=1126212 RepID=K2RCR7_MACPH|nr:hypothetical protein MPH_12181 [Macrophomina phaseolina MS6]
MAPPRSSSAQTDHPDCESDLPGLRHSSLSRDSFAPHSQSFPAATPPRDSSYLLDPTFQDLNILDPSSSLDLDDYDIGPSAADQSCHSPPSHEAQDMSSLGFMMPTQYGSFPASGNNFDYGYAPDQTQQSSPQHQNYTQSSGAPSPYMQSYPGVLRSSPGADYPSRHGSIASSSASGGYVPVSSDGASMAGANAQTSPYPPIHPNMPAPYGGNYSR